jgi:repressor LexA
VVNYYLEQLEERGYIERDGRVSRGIRLLQAGQKIVDELTHATRTVASTLEELLHIPVVGRIFASQPVPVPSTDFGYFDSESAVDIARSMLSPREKISDLYALEVQGDSMIDAMVNDGDYVIMKTASEAHNGEMVAVWLKDRDETTLKYFFKEGDRIRLQPANPTMGPIYVDDPASLEIQGKVVMVFRQLESPTQ